MSIFKKIVNLVRKSEKLTVTLQLSPAMLWILLVLVIPLCIIVIYSFGKTIGIQLLPERGLHNFIYLFTGEGGLYRSLLLKSLGMALLITVCSIAIAYPVAYFISLRVERYKYTWLILLMGPYLVSWVIIIVGWRLILGYGGLLNYVLVQIGLLPSPMGGTWGNWGTVVFILMMGWAPWLVFPIFVSLEKIDRSVLEAAADLGANPVKRFLRITLPLSSPGLLVATFFVLLPTFGEFVTPILAGGSGGAMYGMIIESAFMGWPRWPFGSAASVVLMIISLVVATALLRVIRLERLMEVL
jgi:spermidine/putrescine transport system permease protein